MEQLKTYKNWPHNKKALQKRLFRICEQIDRILKTDFPFDSLKDNVAKDFYKKKFCELFQKIGYLWDKEPQVEFGIGHICCSSVVTITFYIKGRNGEIIEC